MPANRTIGFLGLGGYVPKRVMTNDEWAEYVDTSDEWIRERTGIERRRIAADDENTADLAVSAAKVALADAGLEPEDLDEIIVATDTPEVYTPDTASFVQHKLGAREVPACWPGRGFRLKRSTSWCRTRPICGSSNPCENDLVSKKKKCS